MQFGSISQSVQLAVATPLVEASLRMLDAANIMNAVFGNMLPGTEMGFGSVSPFTNVLQRMTPLLERIIDEGISVNVSQQIGARPGSRLAAFR
jgi:hypothetical protein